MRYPTISKSSKFKKTFFYDCSQDGLKNGILKLIFGFLEV